MFTIKDLTTAEYAEMRDPKISPTAVRMAIMRGGYMVGVLKTKKVGKSYTITSRVMRGRLIDDETALRLFKSKQVSVGTNGKAEVFSVEVNGRTLTDSDVEKLFRKYEREII